MLTLTLVGLSFAGSFIAGLIGVGGAIVMIPLLLYVPPLLGVGQLDVRTVAAVTMVQVFFAALSGMLAHRRIRAVKGSLGLVGGVPMGVGAFTGALASKYVGEVVLLMVFGFMTALGVVLTLMITETAGQPIFAEHVEFDPVRAGLVALGVGLMAGLVGAGGAFLLVPLLLVVVKIPLRVTIGSSLAITAVAATAGLAGKLVTGQVPLLPAVAVVLGALPGAQLGAVVSRRLPGRWLKYVMVAVTAAAALRVWLDILARSRG